MTRNKGNSAVVVVPDQQLSVRYISIVISCDDRFPGLSVFRAGIDNYIESKFNNVLIAGFSDNNEAFHYVSKLFQTKNAG